jgi:hypothetical protein
MSIDKTVYTLLVVNLSSESPRVLSSILLASPTEAMSRSPVLQQAALEEVPTFIWVQLEHLMPNQDRKSWARPFSRKMMHNLG